MGPVSDCGSVTATAMAGLRPRCHLAVQRLATCSAVTGRALATDSTIQQAAQLTGSKDQFGASKRSLSLMPRNSFPPLHPAPRTESVIKNAVLCRPP